MANTTWYGDGTVTVAVGSRTVTGTDTGWLTEVAGLTPIKVGDKFGIHVGRPIVIEQIISDTELLLADDWPGPAQTDAPYKVELTSPTIAAVEAMRRLLASLSNGNLDSLSEITVSTDDIPIGIGPGVFGTINKAELVQDGGWELIGKIDMAGLTTAVITNLGPYSLIRCRSSLFAPSGTYFTLQVSTDNGATFISATSDYEFTLTDVTYDGSTTVTSVSSTQFPGIFVGDITSAGVTEISNFNKPRPLLATANFLSRSPTMRINRSIGTTSAASSARNALRVQGFGGAATYGELYFWGVRG